MLGDRRSELVERLAFGDTLARPGLEVKETAQVVGEIAGLTFVMEGLEIELLKQLEAAAERKREMEEGEEDGYDTER